MRSLICLLCLSFFISCSPKAQLSRERIPPSYAEWKLTTQTRLDYPIPGHENRFRIPRMNTAGFAFKISDDSGRKSVEFPPGTMIVKEIYQNNPPEDGEKPFQLTVMIKSPGDPDAMGGWVWIVKQDGAETVMKNRFCFTCHANANEAYPYADGNKNGDFRDYVFFVPGFDGTTVSSASPEDEYKY